MPERKPDITQRALFVSTNAAWHSNNILLAELKEETPLSAIVVATKQRARWEPGCHPPYVDSGTKNKFMFVPPACIILAYREIFAVQTALNIPNGLSSSSRTRSWLRG